MSDSNSQPSSDEIEICAYCIWVQEGKPEERALDHWLQAEIQLVASKRHEEEARLALISSTSEIQLVASKRRKEAAAGKTNGKDIKDTKASAHT